MNYQFEWNPVLSQLDRFAQGAAMTLALSFGSILLGTLVGTAGAIAAAFGGPWLQRAARAYVEAIRNTPFLIQLFIIFFGLPTIGLQIDAITAAVIAMTVNLGAYSTEIIRAGLQAVHRSQLEAAAALGMTRWQLIRHVALVPAFEKVYPALTSQFTLMMLTSSVVSAISVEELTAVASQIDSQTFRTFESYILVMFIYIGLALLLRAMFALIGNLVFRRRRVVARARRAARTARVAPLAHAALTPAVAGSAK
ncbi:amino acid ABC transporter permease [Cupriavidus sp. YAF13]|uniref:amino acid ABC transporter permease n=1 Tax=Cupriavidus sp. YAF13 TaxID=3233075 RepID=UPI003F905AB2